MRRPPVAVYLRMLLVGTGMPQCGQWRLIKQYKPLLAEGKRALYNTSGRSAVYAAQRRGDAGGTAYRTAGFTPRARSGWSNFRYQQRTYNRHGALSHDRACS